MIKLTEEDIYMMNMEKWYSSIALCLRCRWAEGSDRGDQCTEYHMPLYMVRRKRKCKSFTEDIY